MKTTYTPTWRNVILSVISLLLCYIASAQILVHNPVKAIVQSVLTSQKPDAADIILASNNNAEYLNSAGNQKQNRSEYEHIKQAITKGVSASLPVAGGSGSILLVSSASNKFSEYTAEILLAEGFNGFGRTDVAALTADVLNNYDVAIVGDIALTDAQVAMLSNWTEAGGTLITFSPDPKLAGLLGLAATGGTLANRYLKVQTASGPGKGIVNETIQFKGEADLYSLDGATELAKLYSNASTVTGNPAVTIKQVGTLGGSAVAFTYDLARSVVYLRQGNPDWAGEERDGQSGPIRSNDLFYPDWVDLNKVAIPQADEQQRLLANIILQRARKPLPRFWYLPRGLKAAVVMTGDDHGTGGTKGRFNQYLALSEDNSAEAVADWRAIRGTSYIYPSTPLTDAEAKAFQDQGFEVALHVNTNCDNFTPSSLSEIYTTQLSSFRSKYQSISAPVTNRTHCIAWSDWDSQPTIESRNGIRLDANYYYWPAAWLQNRPGMFTGSGLPMRFASLSGETINCYQVTTQMTDESGMVYSEHITKLLDNALGATGYYGTFCANMHTDDATSEGSDVIIAAAKARNVPVISSKQLLAWLDGRNGSAFSAMTWDGSELNFTASIAPGARSIEGMLPITERSGQLISLTINGNTVTTRREVIKGVEYAFFNVTSGTYVARYDATALPNQAPVVAITSPETGAQLQAPATINITADATDPDGSVAKVEFYNGASKLGEDATAPYEFNWTPVAAGNYSLTAKATDNTGTATTSEVISITVAAKCPCSVFSATEGPSATSQLYRDNSTGIQLGMRFRASANGFVTGVRFYKQTGNTGTHTGQLYNNSGTVLASVAFTNETASGWQQALFSEPVSIVAGTTYVISYHSSAGYYSATVPYFTTSKDSAPLQALASGVDGPNGVYRYTGSPAFPTENFNGGNYWVDVIYNATINTEPGNNAPTIALTSPAANAAFTAPASISIKADATDSDGTIAKVEFFNGTNLLGEDLTSPYEFNWTSEAAGTYQLTARATDNSNLTTTSAAINITVAGATTPGMSRSIKEENELQGNPESEWQISGAGDLSIQGFATDMSYNKGETAKFKIKTNASAYTINIYRLGYYQGNGARLQGTATVTATLPQTQPNCIYDEATGLLDCGNWSESASWAIPADAVSGVYIARLTRSGGGSSHIMFIVRDDASTSDLLFQTSDATWQAYNVYGDNSNGRSLYAGAGGKAVKVSYNRPFVTRNGGGGGGTEEDWIFNAEYPMIRWLEANGYDVTYTTNVDSDRRGNLIRNHKVFMSVGHDEYWSGAQRTHVTNARNAGTHLAFFSGNEIYWKTRWENSVDGSGASHRTLVCYKEGSSGENTCNGKCDPSSEWTGLWRSGCEYTSGDPLACNPENELSGQISWAENTAQIQVPATFKNLRFWRNTSIASLADGQAATLTQGTIGYEWNPEQEQFRATYPKGRIILSRTQVGDKVHQVSLYRHTSGALVFGAGTVQWSWGLDSNHDRGSAPASKDMQQATVNLFADMGVQPENLQAGLTPASATTDTQAPVTAISNPANNTTLPANREVIISGTATDAATIAGVEVSTDGGTTWKTANGTTNWTFAWTPTTQGPATIQSRSFDDSGNMGEAVTLSVTIGEPGAIACPCSIYQPTDAPTGTLQRDGEGANGIQLGMRFKATVDGYVTGVRFYKQEGNLGTHIGQLYSNSGGTALAEVTFENETASGWQEATFTNPVSVKAGTVYVISYFSSQGYYSAKGDEFVNDVIRTPLIAPASATGAGNGLYKYTPTTAYPTETFNEASYFVDVVFNTTAPEQNVAPTVAITAPANNTALQAPATIAITANATDTDGTVRQVEFLNGTASLGVDMDGTDGWSYTWNNVTAGSYSLTAKATDNNGAVTVSEASVVTVTAICPCTVFNSTEPPVVNIFTGSAIQLGMRFRSTVNGYITGVRFYKHPENTGTHTGQLYSNTGTALATVTFENETASGWQEASFSAPVAVSAGTTYIISYHSSNGSYTAANNAFTQALNRSPLIALKDTTGSRNGVYIESTTPAFPTESFKSSNYWVDVVFNTTVTPANNASPTIAITAPANNATFVAPASVTITANATDTDGTVAKVEFYNGENKIGNGALSEEVWTFTWAGVAAGTYQLTAKATDDKNAVTTSGIVNITVNAPANQPPVVSITAPENNAAFTAPATIAVTATATDGDGTIQKVEFFNGAVSIGEDTDGTNGWNYNWANVAAGNYKLTAKATDDKGAVTTSAEVAVTVNAPANQAPVVAQAIPDQIATIGTAFTYTLDAGTFTDPDEDALTYSAKLADGTALPTWLGFTAGTFSGTPPAGSPAFLTIALTAQDGKGGEVSDEFKLTINQPENTVPVLTSIGDKTIAEGNLLSFQVQATDDGVPTSTLTYSLTGAPEGAAITQQGAFTWSPTENQDGVHQITISVSDGVLLAEEQIQVTVTEVNAAPVLATIGSKSAQEGVQLAFTASAADPDLPVNNLEYTLVSAVPEAKIDAKTGAFTWTPSELNGPGTYKFVVKVSDGNLTDEEEIRVNVTEVNQAPVLATIGNKQIGIGATLYFKMVGTDADIPEQLLSYSANKLPAGASLNALTGEFSWKPASNQKGIYKINLRVSDGLAQTGENITITVNEQSVPELISFDPQSGTEGTQVILAVRNLIDPVAVYFGNLQAAILSQSATSLTTTVPAGAITGKIRVIAANGSATSATDFVVLKEASSAPTVQIVSPVSGSSFAQATNVTITADARDNDGIAKVEFYQRTDGGTDNLLGEGQSGASGWAFVWSADVPGNYRFVAKATDINGETATSESITITVLATIPEAPVIMGFSPTSGAVGDEVVISGNRFTGANQVMFNQTAAQYTLVDDNTIKAIVPAGAFTGKISITTPGGTTTSTADFTVIPATMALPVIASFSPASGAIGSEVRITGLNLAGTTKVTFGPATATFRMDNGVIIAKVPGVNGKLPSAVKITVTTPAGSTTTRDKFTIVATSVSAASVSTLQAVGNDELNNLTVYPNPFQATATVNFTLQETGDFVLSLYDNMGALVTVLKSGKAEAGERQTIVIDGATLTAGLYILKLEANETTKSVKLVLEK
ncbi:DUF4082 domain-containing protein [Pontibacter fetidus]|uniref:DUF4082 domain-containing protein n=1 Tax=Pontibacter fetidus TaxID=2700082 RepID=A0A6B2GZD8_9BACT|nr:DUF4082 domain-containing protein [Pontibacter fetidus]NDK55401.1 DUF4082 domain-containing protein [Pontibacter fetidus]